MDVFELQAKLSLDSKGFNDELRNQESGFKRFGDKAKQIIGGMTKAVTAVSSAAAAAVIPIVKSATGAFANYEQLVGGVETLFKDAATFVMQDADKAFQTAGMSMNDYMETATSFAASLIQGLKGDTLAATEYANRAIIDMSDNANKMGTDMEAIENAYRGFSKQNYTMLDNLKLGYGGTKEEMARLLQDAEKLTGQKYDISNFADIVDAIHAIQVQMDVAGTTAKEASTTISGSWNSTKAAWQNMLVAMADPKGDIKKATKNLVSSAKTTLSNVLPIVRQTISGLGDFITEVAPMIGETIPELVAEFVPKFMNAGKDLIVGLGKGLAAGVKNLKWPSWKDVRQFATSAWKKIQSGVENLGGLIFGRKEDGSVNWPTWAHVRNSAKVAWNAIKDKALAIADEFGGLMFGRAEDGSVNWGDWEHVKESARLAWSAIKEKALAIADKYGGLIFGRTEDGSVNWPDWTHIKDSAEIAWKAIQKKALAIADEYGGLVFGRASDGSVNWGDWEHVRDSAKIAWNAIKAKALAIADEFGGLVFGRAEDGTVAWPDITQLVTDFDKWWTDTALPALKEKMVWALRIFGVPTESAEQIAQIIGDWWDTMVSSAEGVLVWALKPPGTPYESGKQIGNIIRKWWSGVRNNAINALTWTLKLFDIDDKDGKKARKKIADWWKKRVTPLLTNALNFTLGLFDLPSVEDMVAKIQEWWEDVKRDTGNLLLNIIPNIFGQSTEEAFGIDPNSDASPGQQMLDTYKQFGFPTVDTSNIDYDDPNFSKGLNYVPYDDFAAVLHRGEMVLTSSEARRFRAGENQQGFNMSALVNGIIGAVQEGLAGATVNSFLNGRDITDDVSRNMIRDLKARRFAT